MQIISKIKLANIVVRKGNNRSGFYNLHTTTSIYQEVLTKGIKQYVIVQMPLAT